MTAAARSMLWFSLYILAAGVPMVLAPALILEVLGFPNEGTDWIRFLGVVVLIVGYYYFNLARTGVTAFFCWSVQMRIAIVPVFLALILVFGMRPLYILFVVPDFLGALWTWAMLRREGINPFRPGRAA
ncbi:hypothetical protein [Zavarzinia compransoris]|uniref:Uncharacterized protein n=1 Tax=Zavarzinia compransoris TaxID=1264899 RepID=A0A317E591_9PROT|nr:hypothetical protein [Zavarzinia compransoris]PWR20563.1 hypothetical protein DKG75_11180 [Zavarzinia compransoris]TDP43791.1 hypothetical protein DES42_10947 [Zavarzinia compransoris]